ncbi:MAG: amidotransferase [Verrucomicrobiota bacterium]
MRVHYLQHVPFEGLGSMEPWLRANGHQITHSPLFDSAALPASSAFDFLIIMGGPMGIYDEKRYPWLVEEKRFIEKNMSDGKPMLGICLGAQLIANVLGATVKKNPHKEIGWFEITKAAELEKTPLTNSFPDKAHVFHWHEDTFEIPGGASHLAQSHACANQGFIYQDRVLALQFHLETTYESAKALVDHCGNELEESASIQTPEDMLCNADRFAHIKEIQADVLKVFTRNGFIK